ncbi:molybdopterin-dependent oxidoreductase [Adlercreutzia faecimuris]|uniref:Molybdopterin-dependent oxidoreductase n=1 Tax=Adlercreutzia faecimuris TaxID=2897341 RepID=A0ABS9WEJ4_9ACTN|nr:molybdopterin-dependent oxidoreductase [Adlercreutzia sp. JBNU-10]MCI2241285.1 molybdopterin-dependent oxidoreductase [Adlercreutzia sp. JBNU-10]
MAEQKTVVKTTGFVGPNSASDPVEIDIADGRPIRSRPLEYAKFATEDLNPWVIRARGGEFKAPEKSQPSLFGIAWKQRVDSPNRILHPMRRVDWDPAGERNPQNRGKSKYVRISWDEAMDILTSEVSRIKDQYGMNSIFVQSDGHHQVKIVHGARGCEGYALDLLGGYTLQARNPDSWEGWYWGAKHMWGQDPVGQGMQTNLFKDVAENSDDVLFWGCDVNTTTWGGGGQGSSRYCFFLRDIGVRQIYVCPDVNYGAAVHADKWIPVLPNTDAALQLAIAHVWMTEGLYDRDYIDTHAVGFDWFEYHVMGGDDGIEKTPAWAEPICGVPARRIKALARSWARRNVSIAHCNGGSFIRSTYSHEPARLEVALLAMQALGHPGRNQLKFMEFGLFGLDSQNPLPRPKFTPNMHDIMFPYHADKRESFVTEVLVPEALGGDYTPENPLTWYGVTCSGMPVADQFDLKRYPAEGCERIHMVWTDAPKWVSSWNGGNEFIDAIRSDYIETVVAQHIWMEDDCLFADLLLPVNTKFEERDIVCDTVSGAFSAVWLEEKATEPRGESLSDYEICVEFCRRMGVLDQYRNGEPIDETIRRGFEGSGCQWFTSFEEFEQNHGYLIPIAKNWEEDAPGFLNFYRDPEAYPLSTPTGKIEFYSQALAEHFPDDVERMPYPRWIEKGPWHPDERLTTPRAERYPFLMVSNHPHFRLHSQYDDAPWIREIPGCKVTGPDGYAYEPVWINPADAARLGIGDGDICRIFNDRGWTMGGAIVTERIMPQVVLQDHGARLDPIIPGVADRAGCNNTICPKHTASKNCCGEVTSGYLVGIEKVDVFELARQYPEAFSRPYDPETGTLHLQAMTADAE